MNRKIDLEEPVVKSVTPYRATFRRPSVWLVQKIDRPSATVTSLTSPAEGAPARALESIKPDSFAWAA